MDFFPIGDLHIESMEQSRIFSDYLNSRKEDFVILLGDVIHFANSIWNPSKEVSIEKKKQNIPKDVSIWEKFLAMLRKPTIYYLGSHEHFALRVISKLFPSPKLKIDNPLVHIPHDFEVLSLGTKRDSIYITGIHIPDNIHPNVKSQEFIRRKGHVEEWITRKAESLSLKRPKRTCLCTHDPTDYYYVNMGYHALTRLLQKYSFKAHYHAHIHSNIRNTMIGETLSTNRSFVALARFDLKVLEPSTPKLRSLYTRNI